MSVFSSSLINEFCSTTYVGFTVDNEGILLLNFNDEDPYLSFCFKDPYSNLCSLWKLVLSDENMLRHMEEDVGIFDPTGLNVFASYFCDAVLAGFSVHRSAGHYPATLDSKELRLRLVYTIGSTKLEGLLKLHLVSQDLDIVVMDMIRVSAKVNPQDQINSVSRLSRPKNVPSSFIIRKEGMGISAEAGDVGEECVAEDVGQSSAPVKAKKRKAVGVSLAIKKK